MITTRQTSPATPASIVDRMADRILDLDRVDTGVSAEDLEPYFTRAEIASHGREARDARDVALARASRQVN